MPACEVATRAFGIDEAHLCKLAGIRDGKCAKPYGVDDLEDRGIGADSQRERQDRHEREPGIPTEQPQGVAQILFQPLDPRPSARFACDFLDREHVAKLAPGGGFRVRARLAALHSLAGRHGEVAAKLLVDFPIAIAPGGHASLRFVPLRMPPMASTSCAHFERSDSNCRRPAAVSR